MNTSSTPINNPNLIRPQQDIYVEVDLKLPILAMGSKGLEVKQLQKCLKRFTGYKLRIDGGFGSETKKAVKNLQKFTGLKTDGVVGPKTWTNLTIAAGFPTNRN